MAFSEEVLASSYMQQPTACLHFAWRITSLRVGGHAARRSCLPGLRRGGGGRLAGAAILSFLVWWCELSQPDRPAFSVKVRRAVAPAVPAPPDTPRRTDRAVGPTQFTPPHQTRQDGPVCVVSGVHWKTALNVFRLQIFCLRQS